MDAHRFTGAVLFGLLTAAQAQTGTDSVQESTDPGKVAAVEARASDLKSRPPQSVVEIIHAKSADGYEILSGGVTLEDRSSMRAEQVRYSLWVTTAVKSSGAYLVDANLHIIDLKTKRLVLERRMEGPWLFIALPEGPYEVSATIRGGDAEKEQTLVARVDIPKTGQRQLVLRFDSKAAVEREPPTQRKGNPAGAPSSER